MERATERLAACAFNNREGGRANHASEAKVSLMLADLEDRGLIRKIKVGRGNIIVFERRRKE